MLGLGFLYRKAQATVDNAIAQLVWGLLMVVPLLVALAFVTAAGSHYLYRNYDPEIANLILAAIFFAISAVIAISYAVRKPETAASEEAKAQEEANTEAASGSASESPLAAFSSADRDILLAALTSAAPYAIRPVLTAAFRNLPLLLVIAVAAFVLSRTSGSGTSASSDGGPVTPEGVPAE
jgi:hypothetical protein